MINDNAMSDLRNVFDEFVQRAAAEAAVIVRENLNLPGSGIHYPDLPNRSSAPGEYPALQSGDLIGSISSRKVGQAAAEIGSILNPPDYAFYLELNSTGIAGARPWLSPSLSDPRAAERILKAGKV